MNQTHSFRLVAKNGKLLSGKDFMLYIERISRNKSIDIALVVTTIEDGYSTEKQLSRLNFSIETAMQMARDLGTNITFDEARILLIDKAGLNRDVEHLSKSEMSHLIEHSELLIESKKLFD